MSFITLVPPIFYNVLNYQAVCNGTTDDTAAIQSTIAAAATAGGGFVVIPGLSAISSSLNLNATGVILVGDGLGSGLIALASFSGAQMVNITASNCGVRDMVLIGGPATTYGSNPATNGIQITGATGITLSDLLIEYVNGYPVQSSATSTVANYGAVWKNVHPLACNQGFHVLGNPGTSFNMGHHLIACNADQTQNGDCYLFEDCHDVLCTSCFGNTTAGSGNAIHIKGASAAIYFINADVGPSPGPSTGAAVLIESGTNGTPKQIGFTGGIIEGGTTGVSVSAGMQIKLIGVDIINNSTYGVNLTGGDGIILDACTFNLNGSSGASNDCDFQSSTTGHVTISNSHFLTPQGTGAQQVANVANVTAGTVTFESCTFEGSGFTSSNIFNNKPAQIRNCRGYNPLGKITLGAIGASPYTYPAQPTDCTYFISGGTVSAVSIGGNSTGLTSGSFRVPAQQTLTITYSAAPTVNAFSD